MSQQPFTPRVVINVPVTVSVVSYVGNTMTVKGNWYTPSKTTRRRATMTCLNGDFLIDDAYPLGDGTSVIVTGSPVHGENTLNYATFEGMGGVSEFPLTVSDVSALPEEVQILISDFAIPEYTLYNQSSAGNGAPVTIPNIFPDAEGNLIGGSEPASNVLPNIVK